MNKFLILVFVALTAMLPARGEGASAQADSAYTAGNYDLAAALYSEIIVREGMSAGLLYDLGNSYVQLGKDADAILCYERALKMDPGNRMITQNLNYLNAKVTASNKAALKGKSGNVEPDSEGFADRIYRLIAIDKRSNGWAVFAVMAFILFIGALAMYTFTPNILARKTGFFSGLVFLGFTVIFVIFAYLAAGQADKKDEAVLVGFTTELLEQPTAHSKSVSSPLHKGTKIKILDTKTGPDGTEWLQVRLNSSNIGWVRKQDLEII